MAKTMATMDTGSTQQQITIKRSQLDVPDDFNIRTAGLPEVKELAAQLRSEGQVTPIIVRNGGTPAKPYVLCAGYRRVAAFDQLAKDDPAYKDADIMAVVRSYKDGDDVSPLIDNWTENMGRVDVSPFDQAIRIYELVTGSYPVPKGRESARKAVDREVLCERLGVGRDHLGKLVRIGRDIDPDVQALARKHHKDVPLRVLVAISNIKGEGANADAKSADRAKKQTKILESYLERQKALAESGRERAARGSGEAEEVEGEAEGGEAGAKARKPPAKLNAKADKKGRTVDDYRRVLTYKIENQKLNREEQARLGGALEATRFLTGDIATLKLVKASDWAELEEFEAPEEVEAEEAEEEIVTEDA